MESELKEMLASLERTGYCQWMKSEGVPIIEGFSVEDVRELRLSPWCRLGGSGAFVHLYGMEGQFETSKNGLIGHVADWPTGLYHKAHYHGGGAVIVILKSEGYTLLWPTESGTQPYATGRGEEVVELRWREGSVLSPPGGWFHQHFNIGKEAARQLALRFGSRLFPIGLHQAAKKKTDGVYISVKKGGTMIDYDDEDAEIRRRFEANLKRLGTPLRMAP